MIHLPLLTVLSTSPLALAAGSTAWLEATPASSERQVAFRVESKALLEHQAADVAEDTTYFVRTDGTKALTETHGIRVVDDPSAPVIIVRLSWVSYPKSIYGVKIEAARSGKPPQLVDSFECTCGDSDLTEAVIARFPAALEQLAEPEETAPTKPRAEESVTDPSKEPVSVAEPDIDTEQRSTLGMKGKVGIGLLSAGAAGLVAGGVVFARQRRFDEDAPASLDWSGRDYRPPGLGVMIAGSAAAVTGAVLLIVDRVQARRRHEVPRPAAWVAPTPTGIAVAGRF